MPTTHLPIARERRRAAARLLDALLLLTLALVLLGRLDGACRGRARAPLVPPLLEIDVARDPAWRLALLPGVGPQRARALVDDRLRRGPPRTLDDLRRVPGWGPARIDALRRARGVRVLCAGAPAPASAQAPSPSSTTDPVHSPR